MELSGPQRRQFYKALLAAFPDWSSLKRLVYFGLEENLEAIAKNSNLADAVLELILWVQAHGKLEQLVNAAVEANPGSPQLRTFAAQVKQGLPLHSPRIIKHPAPLHYKANLRREGLVKQIYAMLTGADTTAVVLTGIAGAGKTVLAQLIYEHDAQLRRAGSGSFTANALWVGMDPAVAMTDLVRTVFQALGKPLPDFTRSAPQELALLLFNALNTTEQPRLIVLDQFEYLLEVQQGLARSPAFEEWLHLLHEQSCRCRLLFTSRWWPLDDSRYTRVCPLSGLAEDEVAELLRSWDVEITTQGVQTVSKRYDGHPLVLTFLAEHLHASQLSLTSFLDESTFEHNWTGDPSLSLFLDHLYADQLNEIQHALLCAFAVYREPVPSSAAYALVDKTVSISRAQLRIALDELQTLQFVRMDNDEYQLHALVADYARKHVVIGDEQANREVLRLLHAKAAQYYQQQAMLQSTPRLRRRINDVHHMVEAVWHWCQAGQWQEAYAMIAKEQLFMPLLRWGENTTLLMLYQQLLPLDKWHPQPLQEARCSCELGEIYFKVGRLETAKQWLEQALQRFRELGERAGEAHTLNKLGEVLSALGPKDQAISCYEQVLGICKEIPALAEKGLQGVALNDLGKVYHDLGKREQALAYYEQALPFQREVSEEATTLNNLGGLYKELGRPVEAHNCYQKALGFFQEVGDRQGEGVTLNNLGEYCKNLGKRQEAQLYFEQALQVFRHIGDRLSEARTLRNLGRLYLARGPYKDALTCLLHAEKIFAEMHDPRQHEMGGLIALLRDEVGEQQFEALRAAVESQQGYWFS